MKKLILFRHGKSRWDAPVNDRERDLEAIGIERTQKSAKELVSKLDFIPEKWFSSPALRAFRTAGEALKAFPGQNEIQISEALYTFSLFDLLKEIKNLDDKIESAIIFGHNEAFTEFVNRLGDIFIDNLPTSGVAWLEFNVNQWDKINRGRTRLIIKPKNL